MFTVYIDDSGTAPRQQVAVASAFIVPALQIVRLEREWNGFSKKEGFSALHTSAMVARNTKEGYGEWDDEKQGRVLRRARQLSLKYGLAAPGAFSFAVNKDDYDEIVPETIRGATGRFHYTWAIRHLMFLIDYWRVKTNNRHPLQYVFDWMGGPGDERRREVEDVMAQAEAAANATGRHGDYTNYSFRRDQDIPGLQCVDAIAWTAYNQSLLAFSGRPPHPLANESWRDYGGHLGPNGWLRAVTMTRERLQDWMEAELKDGTVLKRIKQWEETGTISG